LSRTNRPPSVRPAQARKQEQLTTIDCVCSTSYAHERLESSLHKVLICRYGCYDSLLAHNHKCTQRRGRDGSTLRLVLLRVLRRSEEIVIVLF
jgi:hypothetical protein